ncbi:MFS transporter [Devosia ginsengisoli]|uniref:MFS transporter n=1 Tax=Devosia ginsengisoli TaxID=400770 RepID=A0A5B8LPY6_9HYPH|nr:MFS transporter [Devosia ginsengisoli]QDZ10233.1 MFS transporter [Devosia ginsengisoli]
MAASFQFGKILQTLAHRNFGVYVAGNVGSLIGTWMQRIAAGWFTWELTQSATWLGLVAFADLFPAVVIAPFAGVAADRWDRLKMMKLAQILGFLIGGVLALLFFAGQVTVWTLLIVTLMLGTVDAFVQPFRLAFVSALVPRSDLTTAVAIKSITFNLARFVGPAIAGIVIATVGVGWAFAANALSFLVLLGALLMVRLAPVARTVPTKKVSVIADAIEGVRHAVSTPGIGIVLGLLSVTCLAGRPVVELLPGWAGEIFSGNASDLAALTSAVGIGAVFGGLWLAGRPSIVGLVRAYLFCCLGMALSLLAFSLSFHTLVALPTMVVSGFFLVASAICAQTLVQVNVEDGLRGRVLSVYAMILRGGPAVGALIMGYMGDFVGLRWPLIGGCVILLVATGLVFLRRRGIEDVLEGRFKPTEPGSPPVLDDERG